MPPLQLIRSAATDAIRSAAHPLSGQPADYDPLLDLIGDAQLLLLGEASHGTREFYRTRIELTQRLILERQCAAVAVEADWPDAYRVNRYVQGRSRDASAAEALGDFQRFPRWMWRNTDVAHFIEWLRRHNESLPSGSRKVGFYGLDLYSLHASMQAVVRYLEMVDADAASQARARYACFDQFGDDPQRYGYAAAFAASNTCEDQVVAQLRDLHRQADQYVRRDGFVAEDEFFYAEQNARLVEHAEAYYRCLHHGETSSWNLRDRHMADTLDALVAHLGRHGGAPRVAVWAHNSHLGDARATSMGQRGELNVGQLMRERFGSEARLIGFTTYSGTVTAASDWDGDMSRTTVRPALPESYEALFHEVGVPRFLLTWHDRRTTEVLHEPRLERAIGVIYRPDTERLSHYFTARLPDQFDAIIHLDRTNAVEPLETTSSWHSGETPETFPTGI